MSGRWMENEESLWQSATNHPHGCVTRKGLWLRFPCKFQSMSRYSRRSLIRISIPEICSIRNQILSWRFYHHFRSDMESPLRQPHIGVQTTVLSRDGSDLAALYKRL